MVNAII